MGAINALTAHWLRPLPDRWRVAGQAQLLAEARAAEAAGPDASGRDIANHWRTAVDG